jgi:hypothetical protein
VTFTNGVGTISTVAGNGTEGYSGDGGPATSAELAYPCGVAVDTSGNIYLADTGNARIRKVTFSNGVGTISTVAGNGTQGYSGDAGAATSAELDYPSSLAVDKSGNIYTVDEGNHVIREVTFSNGGGTITTMAGNGSYGYTGDGGPATSAELAWPDSVAVDTYGDIYIADLGNETIREVYALKLPPAITWQTPAAITYGTPLSGSQLNATRRATNVMGYVYPNR